MSLKNINMKFQFNKKYLITALTLFLIELTIAFTLHSGFIRHTFGDYLVVILLYAILRGCTNIGVWTSSLAVLIFAYTVECLQLTPFLTYFNLERSFTAKLIFGSTFEINDLIAYTLGVITVLILETKVLKLETKENAKLWKP